MPCNRELATKPRCLFIAGVVMAGTTSASLARDDSVEMEEVVVSTTRTEAPVEQTGSSVTVISEEEIRKQGAQKVTDVLKRVPGLSVAPSNRNTVIKIRGASQEQSLLMIDGIRMNQGRFGRSPVNNISVEDVERIEIIRGPQSVLFGGEAAAGVINIITRKGRGTPSVETSAEFGSFGTSRFHLNTRGAVEDPGMVEGLDYSLTVARFESDWISIASSDFGGTVPTRPDGRNTVTISGNVGVDLSDKLHMRAMYRMEDTEREIDGFADNRTPQDELILELEDLHAGFIETRYDMTDDWEHILVVDQTSRTDEEKTGETFETQRSEPSTSRRTNYRYQTNYTLEPGHIMTLGAETFDHETESGDTDLGGDAGFAQYQGVSGDLFYTLGIRSDDDDNHGSFTTGRITGAYFLGDRTKLKGNVATGFRSPTEVELFGSSISTGNPDLDPEESFGAELGFEREFPQRAARFGITLFYNEIDKTIRRPAGAGFSTPPENLGTTEATGAEFMMGVSPTDRLSVSMTATYTDVEIIDEDGNKQISENFPEFSSTLTADYRVTGNFDTYFDILYQGEREEDVRGKKFLDPYVLANLSVEYDYHGLKMYGRIGNLFDTDYEERFGIGTPERNLTIGTRYRF